MRWVPEHYLTVYSVPTGTATPLPPTATSVPTDLATPLPPGVKEGVFALVEASVPTGTATPLPPGATPLSPAAATAASPVPTALSFQEALATAGPLRVGLQVEETAPMVVGVTGDASQVAVSAAIASDGPPVTVFVPFEVVAAVQDDLILIVRVRPTPPAVANLVVSGSLGGGIADRLAPPIDVEIRVQIVSSGLEIPVPDALRPQEVFVALPVLDVEALLPPAGGFVEAPRSASALARGELATAGPPQNEFTWLMEVLEDGQFLGYYRLDGVFDPATNRVVYRVPVSLLEGTLFLPVVLRPAYLANHLIDEVHIWSSPFKDAVDFGRATDRQWTVFPVLAPQVGQRILVQNPNTGGVGWIDVYGTGPSGPAA